ncbi:Hypothetical_protein [Hexamita inflata]|uniref:Hypothetical_protein n=1 Tax=Hexamita inflata TaxID=28002 RepID=A0AA86NXG2_9EUKA|nr:Hypothetical protein HINF_LOCUS15349 [Hexamita inflata]CAI9972580.1 Hypothetical protein HINF_LOCUS60225 [Hexamita inflata]
MQVLFLDLKTHKIFLFKALLLKETLVLVQIVQEASLVMYILIQFNNVANLTILNSSILKTNISGLGYVGGFIGLFQSYLCLVDSKIQFSRIYSSSYIGIIVGSSSGVYQFSGSSSTSNYINDIVASDCAMLSNTLSVIGC